MSNPGFLKPDKCVECFNQLDGRWDHFEQIKYEIDKESNNG